MQGSKVKSLDDKKIDGRPMWVCVNFTNLNKACPKDSYLFPRIDRLFDEMSHPISEVVTDTTL